MLWLSVVWAGPTTLSLDLDGDGKAETVRYDAAKGTVQIGPVSVPCDGDPCEIEAHDVSSADKQREVEVCASGPRDDRSCALHTIKDGKLQTYAFRSAGVDQIFPSDIRTSGSGIVRLVDSYRHRLYDRTQKFTSSGLTLTEVKQPLYLGEEPRKLPIQSTFPLKYGPRDERVVANARPNSTILILGEHGEHEDWLLIRLSSGITGFATWETLRKASMEYASTLNAG